MKILNISSNATKRLYQILNSKKRRAVFLEAIEKDPRKSLYELVKADDELIKRIDKAGKTQFNIVAKFVAREIERTTKITDLANTKHPGQLQFKERGNMLTAQRLSSYMVYWLQVQSYEQSAEMNDACRAAIDDLMSKLGDVMDAQERLDNCRKTPAAPNDLGGDFAQVLGAETEPDDTGGAGGSDCTGESMNLDAAMHALEVAINNLPNACS